MKYLKSNVLIIIILVLISFNFKLVFAQPNKKTLEIRDGDFITKDNFLFQGDQNCYNNDPNDMDCWKFTVGELYSGPPTVGNIVYGETVNKGPTVQVRNDFTIDDDKDNPPGVDWVYPTSNCINLPNSYARICIERLNVVKDIDYNQYSIRFDNSKDLSNGGTPIQTSEPVVVIEALEGLDNGLIVKAENFTDFGPILTDRFSFVETDRILLHINDTTLNFLDVFYEDRDNKVKWAGSIKLVSNEKVNNNYQIFGGVNYRNTTSDNIKLGLNMISGYNIGLVLDILGEEGVVSLDSTDDIRLSLKNSTTAFQGFGKFAEQAEGSELIWALNCRSFSSYGYCSGLDNIWGNNTIGTKDEDHRTRYGIIIRAPALSLASDALTLDIPADQVKAVVKVESCYLSGSTPVCGGQVDEIPLDSHINALGFLDTIFDKQDITTFQDASILFRKKYYDIHDELDIGILPTNMMGYVAPAMGAGPIIVTSLSAGDDDYESGVFMEVPRRTITYSYLFDESIPLNKTTWGRPLTINMLGKTLKIVRINSPSSFTIEKVPQ